MAGRDDIRRIMRAKSAKHRAKGNALELAALRGGVAVITGGASGIGFALAQRSIAEGMHVALADIGGPEFLQPAEEQLRAAAAGSGLGVFGGTVDVTDEGSVRAFAAAVAKRFPGAPISLLCCNAGVVDDGKSVVFSNAEEWDRVLRPNLFGVMNCIRAFVPAMIEQDAPGAVCCTASLAAIQPGGGLYGVSKHGCLVLAESLYSELRGRLSVHVLCPEIVRSGLNANLAGFNVLGMPPSRCADHVFSAIQTGQFYCFVDNEEDIGCVAESARARADGMVAPWGSGRPRGHFTKFLGQVFTTKGETYKTTADILRKGGKHTTADILNPTTGGKSKL